MRLIESEGEWTDVGVNAALAAQIRTAMARLRKLKEDHSAALEAAQQERDAAATIAAERNAVYAEVTALEDQVPQLQQASDDADARVKLAQDELTRLTAKLGKSPAESVAPSVVVDGLALLRRYQTAIRSNPNRWDATTIPFGRDQLPPVDSPLGRELRAELDALDEALDAISDAVVAESVHQLVQGNPLRAGATVDAVSRGETPPELEVARTPRSGIGVTHRLIVLLGGTGPAATGWETDALQVRAGAEPVLNAWAGRLLGPVSRVRLRAAFGDPAAAESRTVEIPLSDLRLSPLDVVYTAGATEPDGGTELERLAVYHLASKRPADVAADAPLTLVTGRDPSWGPATLSLDELFELARGVRALLVGSRALDGRDLATPESGAPAGIDMSTITRRVSAIVSSLEAARTALEKTIRGATANPAAAAQNALRSELLRASRFGVLGAVPPPPGRDDADDRAVLAAQAHAALAEIDRRIAEAKPAALGAGATEGAALEREHARVAAVLGPDFRLLPAFTVANQAELGRALEHTEGFLGEDPDAPVTWFQRAARVREGAARLEAAMTYAEALESGDRLALRVAQLPYRPDDRWAALPATAQRPIEGGRLSVIAHAPMKVTVSEPAAGLAVDEWVEVVPGTSEMTGLTFRYDEPGARAPQAVLLAVPPGEQGVWDLDTLESVVLETLELAKLRAVDSAALTRLGHYLPAVFLAADPMDETPTTDIARIAPQPT